MASIISTEELFKDKEIVSTEQLLGGNTISTQELLGDNNKPQSTQDLSTSVIAQFLAGARKTGKPLFDKLEVPENIRLRNIPNVVEPIDWKLIDELASPKGLPTKIARGAGNLVGLLPYFMGGGVGGNVAKAGVTKLLGSNLPRAGKYIASSVGGATTFGGAKALRNIVEEQPITQDIPQEALMGSVFGPTNLIRSLPKAIATQFGLGALIAPKGEKLSTGILFGGLSALTHQRPNLSNQDKANIDALYKEAIFKEGVKEAQRGIERRALPPPTTIYGEGFTAIPSVERIPLSIQKQLGFESKQGIEYKPTLEEGAIRQGEGFSVVGGKQIARPLTKGVAQELRTTPLPDEVINKVQPQVEKDIQEARAKNIISEVVATPKELEPISTPIQAEVPAIPISKEEAIQAYSKHAKEKIEKFYEKGMYVSKGEFVTEKPKGETYYTQRMGVITGPKPENHLLLPQEKIELQNKLTEAIANAPEQGKYAKPVRIQIGNWELKLENDKEKLTNFSNIVNKRGSILIPPEIVAPISETTTKIYRGLAPTGEVLRNDKLIDSIMLEKHRKIAEVQSGTLPQSMIEQRMREINDADKAIKQISESGGRDESIMVTKAADAIDKERAFVNKYTNILDLMDKVGITEGSKASETIFKALDYRRASLKEIAKLTPDQLKFIPIIRNAYKEIWGATGKAEYEGIRDYATHLIQTGKEMGYDVSPMGRFLPDEIYSRFFESRKGAKPYSQDIVKALDVYIPSVARKIFREPLLQEYNNTLDKYLNVDYKNEAVDFMEAFLGRGKYRGEEVLGRLPKDLVMLTYRGTLYGNFSAATKNATQVLTNTTPEVGAKAVGYGYRKLMTPEGRQEFVNSGLSGDFSLGKPIDQLDFFSQVEFVNRGVTYLAAKQKALSEGKGLIEAENYAKKIVRKTQFIQTGVDTPKLYRQYGSVGRILGQFTQFPTKQGFLLWNWARQGQWNKLARFATIAYLLGGTRTIPFLDGIINGDYKQLPQIPEDTKKLIKNVARFTSLAGISGIDIGQNFGLGIYSQGFYPGRGPVASSIGEIANFGKEVATKNIKLNSLQDIVRSRLVQKSLPTFIPGGVAIKKIIDLINADGNDYKIRNAYNQLQYTSSPKEEILRVLVGPTKERKEAWESLSKERQEAEIYRNEHRKMLDYILDSKGDYLALEEFLKQYPNYDISKLIDELVEREKNRNLPANIRNYLNKPKALR